MHEVCRTCFGNPKVFQKRDKCIVCKRSRADYVLRLKMENECQEMLYLRTTWLKVRNFRQASTGVRSVDDVIIHLFGVPYPDFFERRKQCHDIATYKQSNAFELKQLRILEEIEEEKNLERRCKTLS